MEDLHNAREVRRLEEEDAEQDRQDNLLAKNNVNVPLAGDDDDPIYGPNGSFGKDTG